MTMFGDYGHSEEGKLGRPYDVRLLRRLVPYVAPYGRTIFAALGLTLLVTLCDLTAPYITKVAIDRYILTSWYEVDLSQLSDLERDKFLDRYGGIVELTQEGAHGFIPYHLLRQMDPSDRHQYNSRGVLSSEKLHRIQPGRLRDMEPRVNTDMAHRMADGSLLVSSHVIQRLPNGVLLSLRQGDLQGIAGLAALYLLILCLSFLFTTGEFYLLEFTGQRIMQDIRLALFQKIQAQSVSFFDQQPVGRLVTRATNDVENLNEMFKSVLVTVFKDLFLLLGIIVVLLTLNWRLALVCFLFIPIIFILAFLFSVRAREVFRELRSTVARINGFLQEHIAGMRIIQLFGGEALQRRIFEQINHDNYRAGLRQVRVFAVFMPLMELFSSLALGLLIWFGGGKVIQEEMTLGSLVAFIGYIQMFFKPIRDISEKYNIMQLAMASMERIFEFMDHAEEIPEPDNPYDPKEVKGHLRFEDVSFGYGKDSSVIHDLSFEVRPGETVALVGATGSGKTTLVSLAERFYDPAEGAVLLDGIDLRQWSSRGLHKALSLCPQDVFIFAGSVSENISLGNGAIQEREVIHAAEVANASSFIQRLADGFQQELGEGGLSLSTGQRQLLSFARALAPNPKVLILDEATSTVDPETERLIQEAILRMSTARTTLVVAHRLSTIRKADRILVIHRGKIVEQGTHEELAASGGFYNRLLKASGIRN